MQIRLLQQWSVKFGNAKLYDKPFIGSRVVTFVRTSGQSWRTAVLEMGLEFL